MKRMTARGLIVVALAGTVAAWHPGTSDATDKSTEVTMSETAYFVSPESAVDAIRKMLTDEDWAALARYYDLTGTTIDYQTLVSGEFFIRSDRPDVAHPGEFWRYRHPFPPSFEYSYTTPSNEAGIVTVQVGIEIDQGAGQPVQQGWQEFRMRESEEGYRILPN
jgi:hypothetical protein